MDKEREHIIADKTMLRVARVTSMVFTPFSIPFLSFLVLFLFSYLRIMPIQYKLIVLGIVYCFTILTPTITIFLFRNRMLQVRMTVFNSILLIGYYAAFFVFMFMLKDDLEAMSFQLGWALCLPAISIVLNYLSFRAIYRDEVMVKAADSFRLRK